MTLTPEAIPLTSGATEFIIDALLGEAKRPHAASHEDQGDGQLRKGGLWPEVVASMAKPMSRRPGHRREQPRPVSSESQPLIGPKKARAAESGSGRPRREGIELHRRTLQVEDEHQRDGPPRQRLRNIAMFPAAKSLLEKSRRVEHGHLHPPLGDEESVRSPGRVPGAQRWSRCLGS